MDITESYGKYISAIYRYQQILISSELAPYRIGSGQYLILMAIAHKESITQKALSEELLLDKTTITKATAKLEAEGYVRREPDPADNRYHLLYLTEAGGDVIPKVKEALNRVSNQSLVGINEDEYALMLSLLKKVLGNMSELVRNG
ncbi:MULTISPECIES: MarR family winged helix-turn-helix transcriptional regulator [Paenibacillus]|uniref:Winged helix-turn-helix transcriptional regulator n=1 Tax=Paenibacillus xylanilyticus TaxID=248903 RepID=A0A7Y6EU18_9BACL|nr:MarR family winged helix-turn-helix transcriptional regulator [Paenibacillus xylanilyticus]NUU75176.1 winged helix-turn-helix transcriptional regulator [Paenibacillus xylanilyticus]